MWTYLLSFLSFQIISDCTNFHIPKPNPLKKEWSKRWYNHKVKNQGLCNKVVLLILGGQVYWQAFCLWNIHLSDNFELKIQGLRRCWRQMREWRQTMDTGMVIQKFAKYHTWHIIQKAKNNEKKCYDGETGNHQQTFEGLACTEDVFCHEMLNISLFFVLLSQSIHLNWKYGTVV